MGMSFHCDDCGVETFINPPTEQVVEEQMQEYTVIDTETNKPKTRTRLMNVPVMTKMRTQDPHDPKKTIEVEIPKMKDLKPRYWRVQLRVGQEVIDRDFCKPCLDKSELYGKLVDLRNTLEKVERK